MRRRLETARVGHLATVTAGGRPHVVPVCFVLDLDSIYWAVDQKQKATRELRRLGNLIANPTAELVVDHFEEDWTKLWWVRVQASAAPLENAGETERVLDLLAVKYRQYRLERPAGPVVRMAIQRLVGWAASDTSALAP